MTELTLLDEELATALILRSTRQQPALLIQGDTLSIATRHADDLVKELERGGLEEALSSAQMVLETLQGWLVAYERMMGAGGHGLPYYWPERDPHWPERGPQRSEGA